MLIDIASICRTFHGLCLDLLRLNGIKNIPINRSENFEEAFLLVKQKFEEGKIVKRARKIDLKDIGIHTMHKTFGYHYYKHTKYVATLHQIFNHPAPLLQNGILLELPRMDKQ